MGSSRNGSNELVEATTTLPDQNDQSTQLSTMTLYSSSVQSKPDATASVSERTTWVKELISGLENAIQKRYEDRFKYRFRPESERPSYSNDLSSPNKCEARTGMTTEKLKTLNRAYRCNPDGAGELNDGKKDEKAESCSVLERLEHLQFEDDTDDPETTNKALAVKLKAIEEEKSKR